MSETIITLPDGANAYVDSRLVGLVGTYDKLSYDSYFQLKNGMHVLDVGACSGMFTLKAAKIVGNEGLIVSVEPYKEAYNWLVKNVELNGLKNVICLNAALSNCEAEKILSIQDIGHASILPNYKGEAGRIIVKKEVVKTLTIDSLMKKYNIKHFDFLKMDTEGSELEILKGFTFNENLFVAMEVHSVEREKNFEYTDIEIESYFREKEFSILIDKEYSFYNFIYATNIKSFIWEEELR